jgi:23S rRNA (uracil1939-C5)-methyltransferase
MMRGPRKEYQRPQAHKAELRELVIQRVGAQGDGVAEGPVYVPFTLPGETVRAKVQAGRGELVEVLAPSPERQAPPCPHFLACGGCALQHWAEPGYLTFKAGLIREALARERLEAEILPPLACPPASRRRLALHARPGGRDGARLGYKARGSWTLVEIEVCPIADPRLVAAFPALRRLAAAFLEHPRSAPTLHVTWTETGLDIDVTGVERRTGGLSADGRLKAAESAEAAGFARVTLAGEIVYQAQRPTVRLGRAAVALPPGAFLQATLAAEEAMGEFVVQAAGGAERVADLFCGVGTFSLRLAEQSQVLAVDASAEAMAALAAALGGAPGLKRITTEVRDLFRRPVLAQELKGVEAVVFDPPRAGAAAQAAEIAASGASRAIGVSCNPATFARDARILADAGFSLTRVLPVDQFLWSPHVELVGVFER